MVKHKHSINHSRNVRGFTLAELLICLAILGEIATFTVPKILASQQNNQKTAVFKETIGAIGAAVNIGLQSGALDPTTNGNTYFLNTLNATKTCTTNSSTQGCWNTTLQGTPVAEYTEAGLILHNGAVVVGFTNTSNPSEGLLIDWNGTAGPNVHGDDQLYLGYCLQAVCSAGWLFGTGSRSMGAVGVSRMGDSSDIALYQAIYQ